ncbi:sigma-70 family RNA polymerase sigma factor [Adlercreutzia sp. R7]|uniref:Sigma-70 family RNA polymerase sigma factor n=1 Tax=Adlercreutzia wanghongyangiae TaxID=3111451 RepID=A0ABU6IIE6_9ACTN|nr:sigma-70 family RNA polymerase sigma factor [Adlercreutzia sp. R7]
MRTPLHGKQEASLAERALMRWGDTVYRVALGQTGSRADAEDVYQDVFLKLLDKPRTFENDDHLKAWLIRVTVNQSRDRLRARARHATDSLDDHREEAERRLAQAAPQGSHMSGNRDDPLSDLWDIVSRLPEDQRTVINLFYVEEMSTGDIARILGCTAGAVRMRLHRAREALRDLIGNGSDDRDAACGGLPTRKATVPRNANLLRTDNEKETRL